MPRFGVISCDICPLAIITNQADQQLKTYCEYSGRRLRGIEQCRLFYSSRFAWFSVSVRHQVKADLIFLQLQFVRYRGKRFHLRKLFDGGDVELLIGRNLIYRSIQY
jgi:hypothetical protein